MIVVDELRVWPHAKGAFRRGSCHLMYLGDEDVDGMLHFFARKLGLKRGWFQDHPTHPHYDLTPSMRDRAVQLGAREVLARDIFRGRAMGRGAE